MRRTILVIALAIGMLTKSNGQKMNELKKVKPYSITFSVSNLEKTANWYEEKLGFKKVQEKQYPEFNTALVFLELNGYRVELIKDGKAVDGQIMRDAPPSHTSKLGQSQFCLQTNNLKDIKTELRNNGVDIEWEFENAELGVKFLFIRDPEGNLIQYLQKLN